tara:strand:- start:763 stop:978 length:216 start_codon:yes stop_codon:yes gene_type:complete
MKFNRKEYELMYDAFQYMEFKMSREQKEMAERILDRAFDQTIQTEESKITQEMVDASLRTPMWYELEKPVK